MDETQYWTLLSLADQELLRRARGHGGKIEFDENYAWPGKLTDLLEGSTLSGLLRLQFATERYYARQITSVRDHTRQDELLALAYLRVVRLQFARDEPDMGFSQREFAFVIAAIRQYLGSAVAGPGILEIGCGAGSLLLSLAETGYRQFVGIDVARSAVDRARRRLDPYGLAGQVRQATAGELLGEGYSQMFDLVLLCDVIEHIPRDRAASFLTEVRQLLRKGGVLIAVTPNSFTGPHDITRQFRPHGSAPEGLHLHEYKLRELTALLSDAGFEKFSAMRLRNGFSYSRELSLGGFSVFARMAVERTFATLPRGLVSSITEKFYFSALCAR